MVWKPCYSATFNFRWNLTGFKHSCISTAAKVHKNLWLGSVAALVFFSAPLKAISCLFKWLHLDPQWNKTRKSRTMYLNHVFIKPAEPKFISNTIIFRWTVYQCIRVGVDLRGCLAGVMAVLFHIPAPSCARQLADHKFKFQIPSDFVVGNRRALVAFIILFLVSGTWHGFCVASCLTPAISSCKRQQLYFFKKRQVSWQKTN